MHIKREFTNTDSGKCELK